MSEPPRPTLYAPGAGFNSDGRRRLAEATRRLVDAIATVDAGEPALEAAAAAVEAAVGDLTGVRPAPGRRPDGLHEHHDYLPRSPMVGDANPLAVPIELELRDGRAFGTVTFPTAYQGPPGCVHGGVIAASFDELFGAATIAAGVPAMTGTLTIRYRAPTPLHVPLSFEAWVDQVDGRRALVRGTLHGPAGLTCDAEGLMIQPGEAQRRRMQEALAARREGGDGA